MGRTVYVAAAYSENISSDPWGTLDIGVLDAGLRPAYGLSIPAAMQESGASCILSIDTSGSVRFRLLGNAGHHGWLFLSGSYPAA